MEWSEVINDPILKNLPFKLELNRFGKVLMSPPSSVKHGQSQFSLSKVIDKKHPEGQVITECPIQTTDGVKVADIAWASAEFMAKMGSPVTLPEAPELCVEIVSPSNSREEMRLKKDLYLEAGAQEVWIVYIDSHMDIFTAEGQQEHTGFSDGVREQIFK